MFLLVLFRHGLIVGLFLLLFLLIQLFILPCTLLVTGRFGFVLFRLRLGFFLPRGFLILFFLVLAIDKGCTSKQQREYRHIQES